MAAVTAGHCPSRRLCPDLCSAPALGTHPSAVCPGLGALSQLLSCQVLGLCTVPTLALLVPTVGPLLSGPRGPLTRPVLELPRWWPGGYLRHPFMERAGVLSGLGDLPVPVPESR